MLEVAIELDAGDVADTNGSAGIENEAVANRKEKPDGHCEYRK